MNNNIMEWTKTCGKCYSSKEQTDREQVSVILNTASELDPAKELKSKELQNGQCYYHIKHRTKAVKCKKMDHLGNPCNLRPHINNQGPEISQQPSEAQERYRVAELLDIGAGGIVFRSRIHLRVGETQQQGEV